MKKLSLALLLIAGTCLFHACGNNADNANNTDSAGSTSSTSMDTSTTQSTMSDTGMNAINMHPLDKEARNFAEKAASGGMMEVQLGQMAQEKAQSQRVKDFGSMMVRDHTSANDELKSLVLSRGMNTGAMKQEHRKNMDELARKTGAAFDKAYISMMVEDHKEDISEYKKASQNLKDSILKAYAAKTLTVLKMHLDSVQAISKMY